MELKKVGLKFFNVLIIGLILSSCTQLRYTDYGRPLDFLKAKKFKSNPVLIDLEHPFLYDLGFLLPKLVHSFALFVHRYTPLSLQ